MRIVKRILAVAVIAAAGVAVLVAGLLFYYSHVDAGEYFRERRGGLVGATVRRDGGDSLFARSWLTLESSSGMHVVCGMLVPRSPGRHPVVIVLGGKATGRYAVDYALDIRDVIIVAPDYPYEPRPSYAATDVVADLPDIRRALFDMPPSVMLATDYLFTRPDVDTTKLVLLGYSFGAPFIPVIAAHDRRVAVAATVYGGADMHSLIRYNVARYEGGVFAEIVGFLAGVFLRPMEPLRFAAQVSPTPFVMINGLYDEQVPRENAVLLHEAVREPKRIVWLESRHVHPKNVELTRTIIRTLSEELRRLGILPPAGT